MKRQTYLIGLLVLVCAYTLGTGANRSEKSDADRQAIERLIDRYMESINTCDTMIVSEIWSHGDNVSFIAPSGRYASYQEIRDRLVVGLFGTVFTKRHLQKDQLKISIHGNSAWSEFSWTFDALRTDGVSHHTKGLETQIFEKGEGGTWRLVHIHYSSSR